MGELWEEEVWFGWVRWWEGRIWWAGRDGEVDERIWRALAGSEEILGG